MSSHGQREHSRRRSARAIVVAASIALVLAACGGAQQSGGDEPAGSGDGQAGGGGELVTAMNVLGPMIWDPPLACSDNEKMMLLMADSLVALDPETRELGPALAESWEISEDLTTWTFRLRPDVPFHDGWGTVTAEDVKFTWEQWISEESCHNAALQLRLAVDNDMNNFRIIDDLTFEVTTSTPVVGLPAVLCSCDTGLQILSKRYFDEQGEEAKNHPIGTGPWQYVSSTPDAELVMEAFDEYWDGAPHFDRLVLKEIPDHAARLAQVQSGEVDLALLDSSLLGEAEAAGLETTVIPDIGNAYMVLGGNYYNHAGYDRESPWIQADNPEAGLAVREAMSLAIDRALILEQILGNQGELTHSIINQYPAVPALTDPSWELPAYDPELAREKLAGGGYPDGFPMTVWLFQQDIDTIAVGETVAAMWGEIGIDVTLEPVEEDFVDEKLYARDTGGVSYVFIQSWKPSVAQGIGNYVSTREDDAHLFHPAIDAAWDQVVAEPDDERTYEIAREMHTNLRDDVASIPLFTTHMVFVQGPDICCWEPIPGVNTFTKLETVEPAN
jgi:peptide/nickel transport system substrate-binding protein